MKLLTVLAATAAAAAVAAALSISAGADPSAGDEATKLATCLRARSAADAPSGADALALKQWLAAHADNAAVTACNPKSDSPATLVSCLRAHGLNPPDNFQLKPWMVRQARTGAGKAALNACGVDFNPPRTAATGKDLAACLRSNGADVPAGADGLALKIWVRDHSSDTKVIAALKLCGDGVEQAPAKANDCGGGAAAPAQKPDGAPTPTATPTPQSR
jgi:hypothetical protein